MQFGVIAPLSKDFSSKSSELAGQEAESLGMDESRVTLRAFREEDLPEFLEWAMDEEVTKYLVWDAYTNADDALQWLRTRAIPHPWLKAICVDGKAAGSITMEVGEGMHSCRGVLGYCIARKRWGQGVATVAVRKMVALAFRELGAGVARVEALVDQRNGASRRVLEKAGFALEGSMAKYLLVKGNLIDCFLFATYRPPVT